MDSLRLLKTPHDPTKHGLRPKGTHPDLLTIPLISLDLLTRAQTGVYTAPDTVFSPPGVSHIPVESHMPLETAATIHDLVVTNPSGGDPLGQSDDHIRLIKSAVKATFPNVTGPVTLTQDQINALPAALGTSAAAAVSAAVAAANAHSDAIVVTPHGSIVLRTDGTVPAGWAVCDGTNGTPNLTNKFFQWFVNPVFASDGSVVSYTSGPYTAYYVVKL